MCFSTLGSGVPRPGSDYRSSGMGRSADLSNAIYPEVEFLGWLDSSVVRQMMLESRALVFPSRWFEGQSMVILEAMAAGLPVMASDWPPIRETIRTPSGQWIRQPGDTDSWAEGLEIITDRFGCRRRRGSSANTYEGSHHTVSGLRNLESIYRSAMAAPTEHFWSSPSTGPRLLGSQWVPESSETRGKRLTALCLVVVAGSALYLATSPDNRFEADDAYSFAAAVEFGDFGSVISPYHLAYIPLVKALYEPIRSVAPEQRALPFMVALGAVDRRGHGCSVLPADDPLASGLQGSGGVRRLCTRSFIRFLALHRRGGGIRSRISCGRAAPAGGSADPAGMARSRGSGVPRIVIHLDARPQSRARHCAPSSPRPAGLAATEDNCVGAPVRHDDVGDHFRRVLTRPGQRHSSCAGYLLRRVLCGRRVGKRLSPGDILPAAGVIGSTVVAANSIFVYDEVRDFLTGSYPGNAVAEELTMGATSPEWLRYAAPVVWLTTLTALAILLWKLRRASFISWRSGYTLYIWLGVYLGIVLLGGGVVQPEVWLLALVPLWAIVVGAMQRVAMEGALPWVVVISLAANSIINGFMPVYLGDDRNEEFAQWPSSTVSQGDLILTADSAGTARYLAYQTAAHTAHIGVGPPQRALESIELLGDMIADGLPTGQIVEALDSRGLISGFKPITQEPANLYITRDLFDPPDWLETSRPASADALRSLGERLGDLFVEIEGTDLYLMRVTGG